jgi:hypothetical protein
MDPKQIEILCPCCKSRILVDVRTEQILRTRRAETLDEAGKPKVSDSDWENAFGKVRERSDTGGKLDSALDRERRRASELEERFRKANDKLRGPESEPPGKG